MTRLCLATKPSILLKLSNLGKKAHPYFQCLFKNAVSRLCHRGPESTTTEERPKIINFSSLWIPP